MTSAQPSSPLYTSAKALVPSLEQSLKITNRVALFFAILTILLLLVTITLFGVSASTSITLMAAVLYLSVIGLNRFGFINVARILLCAASPIVTLYITLILKESPTHSDILYYDSRILLLIFSTLPCLVFHSSEKFKLYGLLALCFFSIVFFDTIHELLGQGYYQKGFTGRSYYYINYISVIAFLAISAGTLTLKIITEKAESLNEKVNLELHKKNGELQLAISEIETQNEEMLAQAEELRANQEKIEQANTIIQNQSTKLSQHNEKLGMLVQEKSTELIKANEELVKHNGELRQFSYTVSHNLRAPVARLLGLTTLLEGETHKNLSEDTKKIIAHIRDSSQEFDVIIRDLNKIIDIRNEIYRIKEKVIMTEEFEQVMKLIRSQTTEEMKFNIDFERASFIYTVRPVLNRHTL